MSLARAMHEQDKADLASLSSDFHDAALDLINQQDDPEVRAELIEALENPDEVRITGGEA